MGETVEDIVQKYLTPEVLAAVLAVVLAVFLTMVMKGKDDLKSQLISARKEIRALCDTINCGPILIRLAWHDSGTYDASVSEWTKCGGANGSIRFEPEILHGANAGLSKALKYLTPIKVKHPKVSWADLLQLASAEAVAHMGGPKIDMRYGRVDTTSAAECAKDGNLPGANAPFGDGSPDAPSHLRNVFHRMGFSDGDIVALSGAHTIGRAFKERSGTTAHGYGAQASTKFTCPAFVARHDGQSGVGMAGGQSWTEQWLKFDNSYFAVPDGPDGEQLLRLETDACLAKDPAFKPFFDRYAASQDDFFKDYAAAHKKLSELGSKFEPSGGITL